MHRFIATVLVLLVGTGQSMASEARNVMFILDASNSMWGRIDGKPKIEIAKDVLSKLVKDMPAQTRMAMVSYGHRFSHKIKECTNDIELLAAPGHMSKESVKDILNYVVPRGQTPIAQTLIESARFLKDFKGQNNSVVLITDGVESCDGDPCAAAKALNDAGISTKIHVVGFDLSATERSNVACISANGNGKYFDAKDTRGLVKALDEVKREVAAPPAVVVVQAKTEPKLPPKPMIYFEDYFDGDDLAEGWEVSNPNPDRYVVEAGKLLMVAGKPAHSPSSKESENLIVHPKAMPKGDWVLEVGFKIEMQSGAEAFYFGVQNDNNNWLAGGLKATMGSNYCAFTTFLERNEGGKVSAFNKALADSQTGSYKGTTGVWRGCKYGEKYGKLPFTLKLSKTGRSYQLSGSYGVKGEKNHVAFQTENLKMFRGKKNLFLSMSLLSDSGDYEGEGSVMVDYVRVQEVGK